MILNFYRTNESLKVFTLPLLAALFWALYFIEPTSVTVEHPMPLFAMVQWLHGLGYWVSGVIAIVVIGMQALVINNLFNGYEFTRRATTLAALLLVLTQSIYVSVHGLQPVLIVNLLMLFVLRKLLSIHRQNSVVSVAFDAGFLAGIASLFYFPAIILLPVVWGSLSVLRQFIWREHFLAIIGTLLPWLFCLVWVFYDDAWELFGHLLPYDGFDYKQFIGNLIWTDYALLVVNILLFIAAARHFLRALSISTKRERNIKQIFMVLSFFLIVLFGLSLFNESETYRFSLLSIPLAVLYTYYFFSAKRKGLANFLFYAWLILAGVAQYVSWADSLLPVI
jgi:hypothetical protein